MTYKLNAECGVKKRWIADGGSPDILKLFAKALMENKEWPFEHEAVMYEIGTNLMWWLDGDEWKEIKPVTIVSSPYMFGFKNI